MKTEELFGLFFTGLFFICFWYLSFKNKSDQEQLDAFTRRQDQVIKTYKIAKMIISGTAFESLQFTV